MAMDPDRLRSYLQVACVGLGFDIGEVWWTSSASKPPSAAPSEDVVGVANDAESSTHAKHIRFVQLWTSKSYAEKKDKLVSPSKRMVDRLLEKKDAWDDDDDDDPVLNDEEAKDVKRHALSPRLVNAIADSSEIVWANCQKREGLLGRSDMLLQTAVGLPVAMDNKGHMCVVVMFSASNVQNNDSAMDYLQAVSRIALQTSIPCLHPVLQSHSETDPTRQLSPVRLNNRRQAPPQIGDGVVARYVSFRERRDDMSNAICRVDDERARELTNAPKDTFGIPMLPLSADDGGSDVFDGKRSPSPGAQADAFDEASYGVWSTVMNTLVDHVGCDGDELDENLLASTSTQALSVLSTVIPSMPAERRERLEEFALAFLGVSVFDAADVWIPAGGADFDTLYHVTSITSSNKSENLHEFVKASSKVAVKMWSGAVGRAFGSGNPVWSSNYDVIADTGRGPFFDQAKIKTALAIPVFSRSSVSPIMVVCFYSFVRLDAVPFVLQFVQQAIRLVWEGLETVTPHASAGETIWKAVEPADLGEMAADLEMQKAFVVKKRPHDAISSPCNNVSFCSTDTAPSPFVGFQGKACHGPPVLEPVLENEMNSGNETESNVVSDTSSTSLNAMDDALDDFIPQPTPVSAVQGELQGLSIEPSPWDQPSSVSPFMSDVSETRQNVQQAQVQHVPGVQLLQQQAQPQQVASEVLQPIQQVQEVSEQHSQWQQHPFQQVQPMQQTVVQQPQGSPMQQHQSQPMLPQQAMVQQQQQVYQPQGPQQPLQMQTVLLVQSPSGEVVQQQGQVFLVQGASGEALPQQGQVLLVRSQSDGSAQEQRQVVQVQSAVQPQQQQLNFVTNNEGTKRAMIVPSSQFAVQPLAPAQPLAQAPSSLPLSQPRQQQQKTLPLMTHNNHAWRKSSGDLSQQSVSSSSSSTYNLAEAKANIDMFNAMAQSTRTSTTPSPQPSIDVGFQTNLPTSATCSPSFGPINGNYAASTVPSPSPPPLSFVLPNPSPSSSVQDFSTMGGNVCLPVSPGPTSAPASPVQFVAAHGPSTSQPFGQTDVKAQHQQPVQAQTQVECNYRPPGARVCRIQGCDDDAMTRRPYCLRHSGNRLCEKEGCTKCAQGSTRFCIAHGGGRRCTFAGCDKGARDKFFCAAHGGGKRCSMDDCNKSAVGGSNLCTSHGGGRRCAIEGCEKSAQSSTNFCVKHGGGKKCQTTGCSKVARGRTNYCAAHGGGVRCKLEGCTRVAIGKAQLCRAHGGGVKSRSRSGGLSSSPNVGAVTPSPQPGIVGSQVVTSPFQIGV